MAIMCVPGAARLEMGQCRVERVHHALDVDVDLQVFLSGVTWSSGAMNSTPALAKTASSLPPQRAAKSSIARATAARSRTSAT